MRYLKNQELLRQMQPFMKHENGVLPKMVKNYGSLQNLAVQISDATVQKNQHISRQGKRDGFKTIRNS